MTAPSPLVREHLARQRIVRPRRVSPAALVEWMGAVQAQDYLGSLWAIGLRVADATEADVEKAIAARTIVRTWPMRGTLHFVPAADVRWMLALLAPRVMARAAGRYRQLGLDATTFARGRRALVRALEGGRALTRHEAYATLERSGVSAEGQRGIHILGHLAQQGILCFGARKGKQPTFVLLDEWLPDAKERPRAHALATLATRYFASHGPATRADFAWWSGLRLPEAQEAIDTAGTSLVRETREGISTWSTAGTSAPPSRAPVAVLLPPWDEYLVAYRDRTAARGNAPLGPERTPIGNALVLIDGRVRGTWKRALTTSSVGLSLDLWTKVTADERRSLAKTAAAYGRFLGKDVEGF